jgi:hypothetical protein
MEEAAGAPCEHFLKPLKFSKRKGRVAPQRATRPSVMRWLPSYYYGNVGALALLQLPFDVPLMVPLPPP